MSEKKPHITVACVVERQGRFLMVSEQSAGKLVYNQPAGHVEPGETVLEAAVRETLEETCWHITLSAFLGVSHYSSPDNGITYIRHSFSAEALNVDDKATMDSDIVATHWLTYDDILGLQNHLRSPMVIRDIQRFQSDRHYTLEIFEGFV